VVVTRQQSAETLSEVSHVPAAQDTPEMESSALVVEVSFTSLRLTSCYPSFVFYSREAMH